MNKKSIKNFVLSFALSLLAVITVNKAVFYTPEKTKINRKTSKIAVADISLFSKNDTITSSNNSEKFASIEALVASSDEIDNANLPVIDIEPDANEVVSDTSIAEEKPATNTQSAKIVELAKDKIDKPNHQSFIELANASEIILENTDEKQNADVVANIPSIEAPIVYSDISDTIKDEEVLYTADINAKSMSGEQKYALAVSNTAPEIIESEIPLIENNIALHKNVDVLTSAESSNIAMLEPNQLISTINDFDEEPDKHITEINLKKDDINLDTWTTSKSAEEDNPWVVAKGNRFAKNKIAQIDMLALETKESTSQEQPSLHTDEEEKIIESESSSQASTLPAIDNKAEIQDNQAENIITIHKEKKSDLVKPEDIISENANNILKKEETLSTTEKPVDTSEQQNSDFEKTSDAEVLNILEPKPLLVPTDESGTKLAYKMIQNLIIPLPEDVASDADIIPQLSSEPNKKSEKTEKDDKSAKTDDNKKLKKEEKESGLFKSISSWFSDDDKGKEDKNASATKQEQKTRKSKEKNKKTGISLFEYRDEPELANDYMQPETPEIVPAELKLSFQPNRAEISGHTLRWIHAFADNARDNSGIYIEIRLDGTSSFALQQKRLNLLSSIFANRGVDFRKVNVIFTSREPNSFIIRNIRFNDSEEINNNTTDKGSNYQHW